MKHQGLLYFFTKTGIISLIIVAMVFATVHKTDALTDESATSEAEISKSQTTLDEPDKSTETPEKTETAKTTETPKKTETTKTTETPKKSETTKTTENPKKSDTPKSSDTKDSKNTDTPQDKSGIPEKSDNIDDTQGTDQKENSTQPEEKEESSDNNNNTDSDVNNDPNSNIDSDADNDINNDSDSNINSDADSDTNNDSDSNIDSDADNDINNDSDSNIDSDADNDIISDSDNTTENRTDEKLDSVHKKPMKEKQVNTSPNSEVSTSKKAKIRDKSTDAVYISSDFNPSEPFIALKDRVKYNEALPLDNIPSFITQEMIIGALQCQDETGYPASVTIAQIIQESGFGKYGPGGESRQGLSYLAYQYCNLFGIKGTGTAGTVNMRTGEQASSGDYYSITAGFRVYNTYTECIKDRADLIKRVYNDLIGGITDANTFAVRIGSRWATSLKYSEHLIQQMQRYDLYRLDRMTLKDFHDMIGEFSNPCPGSYVTSSFGYREFDSKFHKGIDLGTDKKSIPVYAAESGTVIRAEYDNLAGNWVMIDHGNGLVTKYMHFSHTFVEEGQEVTKGQQIGLTGTTGRSTGIHLHFQVEENGVAVDPASYLSNF